jgi:hypothetical protein
MPEGVIKCQIYFKYLSLHMRFFNCEYNDAADTVFPKRILVVRFLKYKIQYTKCVIMLIKSVDITCIL